MLSLTIFCRPKAWAKPPDYYPAIMKRHVLRLLISVAIWLPGSSPALAEDSLQTLIFIRHAEKPKKGLSQLSCQGLNRALALPTKIQTLFGIPDAIYVPDPGTPKKDHGLEYSYVRPLATVEPLAVRFGLPLNTRIAYSAPEQLHAALDVESFAHSTILIAWEHRALVKTVRTLFPAYGGNAALIPDWSHDDFDSIYVLHIRRTLGQASVEFSHMAQGLNGQPHTCPCGHSG